MSNLLKAQTVGDYRTAQSSVSYQTASHWQTWNGSGWQTASSPPGSSNDLYVQAGHTVTLSGNQECNSLFISTGTSSATAGGDGQVALQGNALSVYGKLSCYIGAVNTTGGSGAALSVTPDNNTPALPVSKSSGGILRFAGSSRTIVSASEWGAGATGSNTLFDVEFALNTGENGILASVIKAANWRFSSGTINAQARIAVDNGTTGQGDLLIKEGAVLISGESGSSKPVISRTSSTICGAMTIQGTLKLTGTAPYIQCTSYSFGSNGMVEYARSGNQTFIASSFTGAANWLSYQNIGLSGSGTKTTLDNSTTSLAAGGTLHILGGNLGLGTSASFTVNTSQTTLVYNGTVAQTAGTTEWNSSFANVTINNPNGVGLGFKRTVPGTVSLLAGTLTHNGNLIMGNRSTIHITGGNLASAPVFDTLINLSYGNYSTSQTTGYEMPADSLRLYNLSVDNSKGLTISGNVFINGKLTLNNGVVNSSRKSMLTLISGSTVAVNGSSSFINGPVRRKGNTDIVLPIGSGSIRGFLGISCFNGTGQTSLIAEYFDKAPSNSSSLGTGLSKGNISTVEYWQVETSDTLKGQLTLFWNDGSRSGIQTLSKSDLVTAQYKSGNWISSGNNSTTGSVMAGSLKGDTSLMNGPVTFGSLHNMNVLPVKLLYFRGRSRDITANTLEWATSMELHCDRFELQRSADGRNFITVGNFPSKAPAGNSSQKLFYGFTDTLNGSLSGNIFYRLKQIDLDGIFEYSGVVTVKIPVPSGKFWSQSGRFLYYKTGPDAENQIRILDGRGMVRKLIKFREDGILSLHDLQPGIYLVMYNSMAPVRIFIP